MPSKTTRLNVTEYTCDLCGAKVSMQHKEPDNPHVPHEWAEVVIDLWTDGKRGNGLTYFAYLCNPCTVRVAGGNLYHGGLKKSLQFTALDDMKDDDA